MIVMLIIVVIEIGSVVLKVKLISDILEVCVVSIIFFEVGVRIIVVGEV